MKRNFYMNTFKSNIESLIDSLGKTAALEGVAGEICEICADCIANGGTILSCGNGGSAADAMHFAEELTGRYKTTRRPLGGLCLNADAAALTCIANDFGYECVFSRQIEALGKRGDVLVCFSSSGNSANQVEAIKLAKSLGIKTVMLSGRGGGKCASIADYALVVPSDSGARVQEIHGLVLHTIIESIEARI